MLEENSIREGVRLRDTAGANQDYVSFTLLLTKIHNYGNPLLVVINNPIHQNLQIIPIKQIYVSDV